MEETDAAKEWFVTHEGKQFGPVSIDDLKFEVERGELNPRLDMVWKDGMDDWIPAGELDGLFKKNDEAQSAEAAKEASKNFTGYIPEETEEELARIKGNWPGVGRGSYFFTTFIFPVILGLGAGAAMHYMQGKVDPKIIGLMNPVSTLVIFGITTLVTLKRLQNLGMSRWWYFGMFIPPILFWVYYRTFACPPGYAVNKKLDPLGWFLAILYWLLTFAVTAVIAAMIYFTASDPDKLKEWIPEKDLQKFTEIIENAKQRQAQSDAPEVEPPAPAE